MNTDEKFLAMEEQISDLTKEVARLQVAERGRAELHTEVSSETRSELPAEAKTNARQSRPSRRQLLGKAGLAAGAAATGLVVAGAQPAAAADASHINRNAVNTTTARTDLRYSGSNLSMNIFTAQDSTFASTSRAAAIAGWASGSGGVYNGVYGWTFSHDPADDQTGHAVIAYRQSGRSHIYMVPGGGNPKSDSLSHSVGELRQEFNGNLWHCTDGGTPGTWKKISGPGTGGTFHPLSSPLRAYDSRLVTGGVGPIPANTTRTIPTAVSGMSSGAEAVIGTITCVSPVGAGGSVGAFLTAWEAGLARPGVATMTYLISQTVTSTQFFSNVNSSRQLDIYAGAAGCDIIVDITGFYE